ncbi:MAG TPA: zf-HC2 domain-containing protein [Chloroflexi bacterium]|nr:zf-HC2 domain-containing protein [Chloroflexota bacterium]
MSNHKRESCREMLGTLSLYLDGEAEESLCREIERHMAECEDCRIVVDTLAMTVKLYREHGQRSLPGEARRRLYAALDLTDFLPGGQKSASPSDRSSTKGLDD